MLEPLIVRSSAQRNSYYELDGRIQHWMKQGHLSEGHGKLLASLSPEKQYWFAYETIKKEWLVGTLDNAIKTLDEKKRESSNTSSRMMC